MLALEIPEKKDFSLEKYQILVFTFHIRIPRRPDLLGFLYDLLRFDSYYNTGGPGWKEKSKNFQRKNMLNFNKNEKEKETSTHDVAFPLSSLDRS